MHPESRPDPRPVARLEGGSVYGATPSEAVIAAEHLRLTEERERRAFLVRKVAELRARGAL